MANWESDKSRQIVGRWVIEGDLILDTPVHFGNGETNGTEMVILEVASHALLPGASIAGALRHYLQRVHNGNRVAEPKIEKEDDLKNISLSQELFGIAYKDTLGEQSRVLIDDAVSTNAQLISRDGVRINNETGIAQDGQLFSTQLWNRGAVFPIRIELLIYKSDQHTDILLSGLITALTGFEKREIPMGTRKSRGYGECHVENWRVRYYDFCEISDVVKWIQDGDQSLKSQNIPPVSSLVNALDVSLLNDSRQSVRIDATFKLVDTLLIRSLSDVADTAHLVYEAGTPVLSGTSLAGALRARALKIAKTFSLQNADTLIDDMFGKHGDQENLDALSKVDSKNVLTASRLVVRERAIIDPAQKTMQAVQNRVKIDRFTGGAFETALIAQQPVFAMDDTRIEICLVLHYPANDTDDLLRAETGLLLLLLKDLWTGDLPLGGESSIGRGRLEGLHTKVTVKSTSDDGIYELSSEQSFSQDVQLALETYAQAFIEWTRRDT